MPSCGTYAYLGWIFELGFWDGFTTARLTKAKGKVGALALAAVNCSALRERGPREQHTHTGVRGVNELSDMCCVSIASNV